MLGRRRSMLPPRLHTCSLCQYPNIVGSFIQGFDGASMHLGEPSSSISTPISITWITKDRRAYAPVRKKHSEYRIGTAYSCSALSRNFTVFAPQTQCQRPRRISELRRVFPEHTACNSRVLYANLGASKYLARNTYWPVGDGCLKLPAQTGPCLSWLNNSDFRSRIFHNLGYFFYKS